MSEEQSYAPRERRYCVPRLVDREGDDHVVIPGAWRGLVENNTLYQNIRKLGRNSGTAAAKAERDILRDYFVSPAGYQQAPWQLDAILRNREIVGNEN